MNTSANDGNNNDDFDNNPTNNNNDQNERRRKGKGRKKISMEKIENESNLQVTFSKRRAGVFKKASELSTLCGAESAVVVFSPGNKPHSFGHPSVEAVANRFLNGSGGSMQDNAANPLAIAHGEAGMQQRNRELVALEAQVEGEKNRRKQLDETAPTLDQLDYEQLEQMKNLCVILKQETEAKLKGNADQGLVSPAPGPGYGYGAANIVPTVPGGSSAATSGYPFGYNLPYPPTGPGSFGFSYDGTTGMASGSGSGTGNNPSTHEDADDPAQGSPDQGTGFGGNYGHSF